MVRLEWGYIFLGMALAYLSGINCSGFVVLVALIACFLFIPSYGVLRSGVKGVPIRNLLIRCALGGAFLVISFLVLRGDRPGDMAVLFFASYLVARIYRLFLVAILN